MTCNATTAKRKLELQNGPDEDEKMGENEVQNEVQVRHLISNQILYSDRL